MPVDTGIFFAGLLIEIRQLLWLAVSAAPFRLQVWFPVWLCTTIRSGSTRTTGSGIAVTGDNGSLLNFKSLVTSC